MVWEGYERHLSVDTGRSEPDLFFLFLSLRACLTTSCSSHSLLRANREHAPSRTRPENRCFIISANVGPLVTPCCFIGVSRVLTLIDLMSNSSWAGPDDIGSNLDTRVKEDHDTALFRASRTLSDPVIFSRTLNGELLPLAFSLSHVRKHAPWFDSKMPSM
jgi:hypothetical protein